MKFPKPFFILTIGIAVLLASSLSSQAQVASQKKAKGSPYVNVAIIDIVEIRRASKVVKNITKQIDAYRTKFQEEIKKEEAELRKSNQELSRQRTILSPEAFAEERRKFEQRLVEVQRKVQERRQTLDRAFNNAMRAVENKLSKIVTRLAEKKKLGLIFRRDQTVLAVDELSITKDALVILDKEMPTHNIPDLTKKPAAAKKKSGK